MGPSASWSTEAFPDVVNNGGHEDANDRADP
jgi:hypothetical protein